MREARGGFLPSRRNFLLFCFVSMTLNENVSGQHYLLKTELTYSPVSCGHLKQLEFCPGDWEVWLSPVAGVTVWAGVSGAFPGDVLSGREALAVCESRLVPPSPEGADPGRALADPSPGGQPPPIPQPSSVVWVLKRRKKRPGGVRRRGRRQYAPSRGEDRRDSMGGDRSAGSWGLPTWVCSCPHEDQTRSTCSCPLPLPLAPFSSLPCLSPSCLPSLSLFSPPPFSSLLLPPSSSLLTRFQK